MFPVPFALCEASITLLRNSSNHGPHRTRGPASQTASFRPAIDGTGGGAHMGCNPTASIFSGAASRNAATAGALRDVTSIHSGTCGRSGASNFVYSRITAGITVMGTENTTTSHLDRYWRRCDVAVGSGERMVVRVSVVVAVNVAHCNRLQWQCWWWWRWKK